MKALLLLSVVFIGSVFADYGVASIQHRTVRTKTSVCAIDIVTLTSGSIKIEKSCFKF